VTRSRRSRIALTCSNRLTVLKRGPVSWTCLASRSPGFRRATVNIYHDAHRKGWYGLKCGRAARPMYAMFA
jgi:hypothetical protein